MTDYGSGDREEPSTAPWTPLPPPKPLPDWDRVDQSPAQSGPQAPPPLAPPPQAMTPPPQATAPSVPRPQADPPPSWQPPPQPPQFEPQFQPPQVQRPQFDSPRFEPGQHQPQQHQPQFEPQQHQPQQHPPQFHPQPQQFQPQPTAPPSWPPTAAGPPPVVPQPRKSRKGLLIALTAAAAVIAVVVGVVVVVSSGGSDSGTGAATPEEAVTGYLDALSRADAEAALAYGQLPPASTDLLTDEVLKKQVDTWPITDVTIVGSESAGSGMARVHVTAKFGDQLSDATLITQDTDGWKLRQAALRIDNAVAANSMFGAMKTVTVFGKPADQPRYVFPGWVDIGNTNPNVTLNAQPMLLPQLAVEAGIPISPTDLAISKAGDEAVRKGLADALQSCVDSNLLAPPGCPLRIDTTGLVEGTARWGRVDDLGAVKIIPNPLMLTASLIGTVTLPFTARTAAGGDVTTNLMGVLNGKADLAQSPPVITWS